MKVSYPLNVVRQLSFCFGALPGIDGGTNESHTPLSYRSFAVEGGCLTPTETPVGQFSARAVAAERVSAVAATLVPATKERMPAARSPGRSANGPACVGCRHDQSIYKDNHLCGRGVCTARDCYPIAANDRRPCGLYEFHSTRICTENVNARLPRVGDANG
jgi:hypothetical protein